MTLSTGRILFNSTMCLRQHLGVLSYLPIRELSCGHRIGLVVEVCEGSCHSCSINAVIMSCHSLTTATVTELLYFPVLSIARSATYIPAVAPRAADRSAKGRDRGTGFTIPREPPLVQCVPEVTNLISSARFVSVPSAGTVSIRPMLSLGMAHHGSRPRSSMCFGGYRLCSWEWTHSLSACRNAFRTVASLIGVVFLYNMGMLCYDSFCSQWPVGALVGYHLFTSVPVLLQSTVHLVTHLSARSILTSLARQGPLTISMHIDKSSPRCCPGMTIAIC